MRNAEFWYFVPLRSRVWFLKDLFVVVVVLFGWLVFDFRHIWKTVTLQIQCLLRFIFWPSSNTAVSLCLWGVYAAICFLPFPSVSQGYLWSLGSVKCVQVSLPFRYSSIGSWTKPFRFNSDRTFPLWCRKSPSLSGTIPQGLSFGPVCFGY